MNVVDFLVAFAIAGVLILILPQIFGTGTLSDCSNLTGHSDTPADVEGWAESCDSSNDAVINGYQLLTIVVVVIAIVAIVSVLMLMNNH